MENTLANILPKSDTAQQVNQEVHSSPEVSAIDEPVAEPVAAQAQEAQQVQAQDTKQAQNNQQVGVTNANNDISYEQKYKELQAEYAKSKHEIAAYAAKVAALEKNINAADYIDQEKLAELEELKFTNPDLWRAKLNELEAEALAKVKAQVNTAVELERRKALIADYNANNPNYQLTDYVVDFVLPRGIIAKLEKGETTFEAFLQEASDYLKNTTIGSKANPMSSENAGKQAPINEVGGSATVTSDANAEDIQWWL